MIKIAIKNPAPLGKNLDRWGDYHFGLALATALEGRGAKVVQHFWPEWDRDDGEDLIIVLRGKRSYVPPAGRRSLMWIISHPATVLADEMMRFSHVYVASETHYRMVRNDSRISVDIARQCTDTTSFNPTVASAQRRGVSFVANSRGVRRDILTWSIQAGVKVSVVGRHWKALGLQHLVVDEYIPNEELPRFYGSTRLTLNDHWGDMCHYGYINNRIFDCLSCGTPLVTDHFPELLSVCNDRLLYAHNSCSFWDAIRTYYLRYSDVQENAMRLWQEIGSRYSFDSRAEQILEWATSQRWSRHASRASSEEGVVPFQAMVSDVIHRLRERGITRELQSLHICPTRTNMARLFNNPELSYLSGGLGSGPWHVFLDTEMSCLANFHFDIIIIEDVQSLLRLPLPELTSFVISAQRKLSKRGVIIASGEVASLPGLEGWQESNLPAGYVTLREPVLAVA